MAGPEPAASPQVPADRGGALFQVVEPRNPPHPRYQGKDPWAPARAALFSGDEPSGLPGHRSDRVPDPLHLRVQIRGSGLAGFRDPGLAGRNLVRGSPLPEGCGTRQPPDPGSFRRRRKPGPVPRRDKYGRLRGGPFPFPIIGVSGRDAKSGALRGPALPRPRRLSPRGGFHVLVGRRSLSAAFPQSFPHARHGGGSGIRAYAGFGRRSQVAGRHPSG